MRCLAKERDRRGKKVRCKKKAFLSIFLFCYDHWTKGFRPYGAILGVIALGYTVFGYGHDILDIFKSKDEKEKEQKYDLGILSPFTVGDDAEIDEGGGKLTFQVPDRNINLGEVGFTFGCFKQIDGKTVDDQGFNYWLTIRSHKMYITLTVRDLKTAAVIGELRENEWLQKKDAPIYRHFNSDSAVEIIDQYKNVAFRLWVDPSNHVHMRGYFVGNFCTSFLNTSVLQYVERADPQYEIKASEIASRLKPMFVDIGPSH